MWLNINFELSYNFVETLQVIAVVPNTINVAQLDMIYVLQRDENRSKIVLASKTCSHATISNYSPSAW